MKNNNSGQDFSVSPAQMRAAPFDSRSAASAYNYFVGANAAIGMPRPATTLMTRREAATYLGVSEHTLAIWKTTGRYHLPSVKIGRLVKYRLFDLDEFIAKHLDCTPEPIGTDVEQS